ncbi:MAG: single-stranded-DNA-specific exonuclease RecJ [Pirellulaceae bacterium]
MGKRWRIKPHDVGQVMQLERAAQVPPVVAQLLVHRGIVTRERAADFLEARMSDLRDPASLPGMDEAASAIFAAVSDKKKITIYGDYDADGMTATGILVRCLTLLGADVNYYVPNRLDEGYGLSAEALQKLANRGTQMVVTVDCGIASVSEAQVASELGLELVITDHHTPGAELPAARAIVHPGLASAPYPFPGLCGAGVAFKLAWALCRRASNATKVTPRLKNFLVTAMGLAAMGTVADVVPLVDENRVLVRHGLNSLKVSPVLGVAELMRVASIDSKPTLSSEDIGFVLGPRLNAAGRLGQAQLGVELLTTESSDRARALAEYIHQLNNSRDSLERSIYLAATKQIKEQFDPINDPALVLAGHGWHSGVIGIVAGRLAEKHARPVVMIALDELGAVPGTGSARSANGLNLHQALAACDEHLISYGGHAAAAGLRIDAAHVERFRDHFCEYVSTEVAPEDRVEDLYIDAEAPLLQLTLSTVTQIEQLAPFGQANPRPVLCAMGVSLDGPPRRMGSGERHMTATFRQHSVSVRGVAFGQGDWVEQMEQTPGAIDIAYRPVINEFRGRRNVEIHLVDWRPSDRTSPSS